jgi:RadC-like JAB domain
MKTLSLRPDGAKKSASVCPDPSSRLLLLDLPAPEFELPDPGSLLLSDAPSTFVEPPESQVPPIHRAAIRRAFHQHGDYLRGCQFHEVLAVGLNRNCVEIGYAAIAQGGLSRAPISLLKLLAKMHALEAVGLILMQNLPGAVDHDTPIDPSVTLKLALFCELAGMPLVEHVYVNTQGEPFFVRERGILKGVPELVVRVREGANGLAKKELDRGICAPNHYKKQRAAREAALSRAPVEVLTQRRPGRGRGEDEE